MLFFELALLSPTLQRATDQHYLPEHISIARGGVSPLTLTHVLGWKAGDACCSGRQSAGRTILRLRLTAASAFRKQRGVRTQVCFSLQIPATSAAGGFRTALYLVRARPAGKEGARDRFLHSRGSGGRWLQPPGERSPALSAAPTAFARPFHFTHLAAAGMAEFLNQAAVLGFLREQGGQVRNSLLLAHFKPLLDVPEATPEVRAALRQRFVHLVNSVAVVRVSEGIKLVVLRNRYQLAREDSDAEPRSIPFGDLSDEETEGADSGASACPAGFVAPLNSPGKEDPEAHRTVSVFQLKNRFQRGGSEILKVPSGKDHLAPKGASQKPCMLPVRSVPPSSTNAKRSEELSPEKDPIPVEDGLQVDLPAILLSPSPHAKRRQLNEMGPKSLSLGRGSKPLKVGEEADSTANVPLEPVEHQWVVKATAGQWSQQLHGLLLIDLNLLDIS
ncbi:ankyrin repeat domain-containing protein SOWAHA [Crotalus adamanteus]|uniref:Ankyrin repeat domain-containing protein SOWAHA n=1 Tax=Crotalus adamanteus TaxID=8729 RepID=A0AAW1BX39_CROAD